MGSKDQKLLKDSFLLHHDLHLFKVVHKQSGIFRKPSMVTLDKNYILFSCTSSLIKD